MNPCIPDWNFDCDLPFTNQKKPSILDNEPAELLWRNGQVVMLKHDTHHHPNPVQMAGGISSTNGSCGNLSILIQDDDTVSWIDYPVEDSFEMEFCSPFFSELSSPGPLETDKPTIAVPEQSNGKYSFCHAGAQFPESALQQNHGPTNVVNFSHLFRPTKGSFKPSNPQFRGSGDAWECSGMTVGSIHCGSNRVVQNEPDYSRASSNGTGRACLCSQLFDEDNIPKILSQDDRRKTETLEPTLTSSSGGSGSSFGGTDNNSAGTGSLKRKDRDVEDSECQSKDAELESGGGKKHSQQSGSTRRSRASEVHNLSERRRRDRINKKMRALQELIPHCNKTDKASMLDEAIEYLRSLQLQIQLMWMGSGTAAPMMFPGLQPYMSSSMGIGVGAHPLATVHKNIHLPRVPVVDHQPVRVAPLNQSLMCPALVCNPLNFHMQSQSLHEQFVRYMGIHQLQVAASQPVNMFGFGPQASQNCLGTGMAQLSGGTSTGVASSGKMN